MVARVEEILSLLDSASDIGELNLPGCRLHALTGKLRGFWSVRVTGNWRTTSRFVNGEALFRLSAPLKSADELLIVQALSGG